MRKKSPIDILIKKVSEDIKKKPNPELARQRLECAGIIDKDGNLIRNDNLPCVEFFKSIDSPSN